MIIISDSSNLKLKIINYIASYLERLEPTCRLIQEILDQRSCNYFYKAQSVNILGFKSETASGTTAQLCCRSMKGTIDNAYIDDYGYVPTTT